VTEAPADSGIRRLRLLVRRYRARVQGLLGVSRLLAYAALGRVDEVWIGDSHAVHVNSATMVTALRRLPDGRWIWHLGPRIMYSIAREGLPPAVLRVLGMIRRTRRAREIVWVFSFGEIDVRCHLAPRMADPDKALAFVPLYLQQVHDAATRAGARRALVLVPPPESDVYPEQAGFPVVGTLAERVKATLGLRDAMVRAVAELPPGGASVILIDVTEEFSDERGAILEHLTYDGLHTNEAGRAAIRAEVERLLRETADERA
jgi:hypothetical protein